MIDPMLSMAFSIHSNKGVYALLMGSGNSRAAGIMTGWEIVLDLVRKLAHASGKDCEPDPAAWFHAEYGRDPGYAELLDMLAKTPTERSGLLRSYFEPTPEERDQGKKVPTEAHKAIAELVAGGYVRVILTTNFDHLVEEALNGIGINPVVIATSDAAAGARPLAHTQCAVVKLHGDYQDPRIKNTPEELASYDPPMNVLLDQVLDEYGLIVCGWSGEWDTALRSAIERCKSHRFTTYWSTVGEPSDAAKRLVELRRGEVVPITGADAFFPQLKEKVIALEKFEQRHPLSEKVAVATLKRYIAEDRHRILLHDLVMDELENVSTKSTGPEFTKSGITPDADTVPDRARRYEEISSVLLSIFIHGCYWGDQEHGKLWTKCIERLSELRRGMFSYEDWTSMSRYPALLLLYGGGISAMASGKFETLANLFAKPIIDLDGREIPAFARVYAISVMDKSVGNMVLGKESNNVPLSDHLFALLRPKLSNLVPQDAVYEKLFDQFEYMLALVVADFREKNLGRLWAPPGCFAWRQRDFSAGCYKAVADDLDRYGSSWPLLTAGLFGGSVERAKAIKTGVDKMLSGLGWG